MSAKANILLIDDDDDFRASVRAVLESEGYAVMEADSGEDGLQKVVKHKPDVIVLDIMMDYSTEGYGVNQAIKHRDEFEEYRRIPILMVSSIQSSPDERFPTSGEVEMIRPDQYMTKPLDFPKFLKAVDEAVKKAQRA